MKYEDKFQNIRQNTNIYIMGWYYAFFQKNFNTRSLIEKVEIIRILRECRKNSKHCDELYCGLWREPQYNYILNEEVNCLSSEEKKIYQEYLQWLKTTKKTNMTDTILKHDILCYEEYVANAKEFQKEEAQIEYFIIGGFILILGIVCEVIFL